MAGAESLALEVAGTRRLIITDMVLENFKSYAGEQHVGPFHKVASAKYTQLDRRMSQPLRSTSNFAASVCHDGVDKHTRT